MHGYTVTDFVARVSLAILSDNRKKAAMGVFVVMLLAIDPRKPPTVVGHHGLGIIATVDDPQKELLVRVLAVKEALYAHGLR